MELKPPPERIYEYTSLDLLVREINLYTQDQGYAVTKARTKTSKKNVVMKAWLKCDRGGDAKQEGHGHRRTASRRNGCPFFCIAKLENNLVNEHDLGNWILSVGCSDHNHPFIKSCASVVHRKAALEDPDVQREITKEWKKGSKVNNTLKGLRMDLDEPIFKPQDIWNANVALKAKAMGSLTSTQALMKHLIESFDWYVDYKTKEHNNELDFLFFTPQCMQELLRENPKVIIIDVTYKINRYKMPLLIIIGVTCLNTTFYVAFCFMKSENYTDYV